MILRARVVVTMNGPPVEDGAVVVAGDRIVDAGKFPEVARKYSTEEIVDLGDRALLPGLINAHCHLDYTCLRGKIPRQKSFTDWIRLINAEKAKLSPADYVVSINEGFAEAKRFGTATMANLTAFPELASRIESPIRTWWFSELIDVREAMSDENLNALCIQVGKAAPHWGLAPHAPFTASASLYRRCQDIAQRENILLTTHLAESKEEMQMFRDRNGALYDFLKQIGRDMSDCGGGTPVEKLRTIGINSPYLLVHVNELGGNDLDVLERSAHNSSIVHCPRSHDYFGHSPFQFEKLQAVGFNICLGTDSLASNDDLSLFAEMRAFQRKFPNIDPEKIVEMVTVNPARALRQLDSLGKIWRDFVADLIAIPITTSTSIYEEIIAFDQPVSWSMIAGQILA